MDLPHQPSHYQGNNTQRLRQAIVDFLENNDVLPQSGPQLKEADQDDKGFPMIEDKKKNEPVSFFCPQNKTDCMKLNIRNYSYSFYMPQELHTIPCTLTGCQISTF